LPGTFSNDTVNAACELCEFGTYQDKSGQTQCHYCENGGFADQAGMAECKFCQVWEYLQVEGISFNCRYCYTKENLYGLRQPEECLKVPGLFLCVLIGFIYALKAWCKLCKCIQICRGRAPEVIVKVVDMNGNTFNAARAPMIETC
jgi:hypothetical protein